MFALFASVFSLTISFLSITGFTVSLLTSLEALFCPVLAFCACLRWMWLARATAFGKPWPPY